MKLLLPGPRKSFRASEPAATRSIHAFLLDFLRCAMVPYRNRNEIARDRAKSFGRLARLFRWRGGRSRRWGSAGNVQEGLPSSGAKNNIFIGTEDLVSGPR